MSNIFSSVSTNRKIARVKELINGLSKDLEGFKSEKNLRNCLSKPLLSQLTRKMKESDNYLENSWKHPLKTHRLIMMNKYAFFESLTICKSIT